MWFPSVEAFVDIDHFMQHTLYGLPMETRQTERKEMRKTKGLYITEETSEYNDDIIYLFILKRHLQPFADIWPTLMGFSIYI
jgi:hypothetical protein